MAKKITLTAEQKALVRTRIKLAQEYQDEAWACNEAGFADMPDLWMALLRGKYWHRYADDETAPRRVNNQVLPKLKAKHDMLCVGETEFFVTAREQRFEQTVEPAGALLNNFWSANNLDQIVDACRWDSDIWGYGVAEVGWRFRRRRIRNTEDLDDGRGEPVVPEGAQPIMMLEGGGLMMDQGEEEFGSPEEAQQAAIQRTVEEDQAVWGDPLVDDPFIERFCPAFLLVDPNCTRSDLSDARYAFRVRFEYPNKLRANSKLSHTKDLRGTVYSVKSERTQAIATSVTQAASDDALVKLFDGYMYLDLKGNGDEQFLHVIMADGADEPLLVDEVPFTDPDRDDEPAFPDSPYPWVVMPGIEVDRDTFYPESAVGQVVDLQLAYDESWNTLNEHRRKSPRQYLFPKGTIDQDGIDKLEAGIDGAMIEAEAALKDQITPFPHVPLQPEVFHSLDALPIEIGRQLGVSSFDEAVVPDKDMRAREVDAIQQSGSARTGGDARRFREFKERLALRLLILMQIFGDRARPYKVTTPEGGESWGMARNLDLRGVDDNGNPLPVGIQHIVKINAENVNAKNKTYDQALKMKLLEVVAQFAQMPDPMTGQPLANIKPVLRMALRSFDQRNLDAIVRPDPSPEEVAEMQAQQQAAAQAEAQAQQAGQQEQAETDQIANVLKIAQAMSKLTPEAQQAMLAQIQGPPT